MRSSNSRHIRRIILESLLNRAASLDQRHPLRNRLAEMLKADRMEFRVNPVMDVSPLLFPGLARVGNGLQGRVEIAGDGQLAEQFERAIERGPLSVQTTGSAFVNPQHRDSPPYSRRFWARTPRATTFGRARSCTRSRQRDAFFGV